MVEHANGLQRELTSLRAQRAVFCELDADEIQSALKLPTAVQAKNPSIGRTAAFKLVAPYLTAVRTAHS